jgi:hypothetical protein
MFSFSIPETLGGYEVTQSPGWDGCDEWVREFAPQIKSQARPRREMPTLDA